MIDHEYLILRTVALSLKGKLTGITKGYQVAFSIEEYHLMNLLVESFLEDLNNE